MRLRRRATSRLRRGVSAGHGTVQHTLIGLDVSDEGDEEAPELVVYLGPLAAPRQLKGGYRSSQMVTQVGRECLRTHRDRRIQAG
jgi:hypothetical protein